MLVYIAKCHPKNTPPFLKSYINILWYALVSHKKCKRPLLLTIFFVFTFQWISEYIGQKIAKSNGLSPFLRDTLCLFFMKSSINNSSLDCREKTHATSCNIKARRELWLTMKKWHNFLPISFLMKFDHMWNGFVVFAWGS